MRAIKVDPDKNTVQAVDFPDDLNTPLADIIGTAEYTEIPLGDSHTMIARKDQQGSGAAGKFALGERQAIAGVALIVGDTGRTWTDATWTTDQVSRGIVWAIPD